ncbi:MAG: outer membrane beta-barrel protein [Acidobacteria bacterium]|nr:outer membrane beta-barrel protein [Acidobacteriota bacterium]
MMPLRRIAGLVLLASAPLGASAQDGRRTSVSATVSAASVDSSTQAAFSAAVLYGFTRIVGLEVEATIVPRLRAAYPQDDFTILGSPVFAPLIYPPPRYDDPDGRLVIATNNVRVAVPTTAARIEPYFVAGAGAASVRRTATYVYPALGDAGMAAALRALGLMRQPAGFGARVRASRLEMALTLGGGVGVRVGRRVAVDADLRLFRLLGAEDRSLGRFGVGVRYRF